MRISTVATKVFRNKLGDVDFSGKRLFVDQAIRCIWRTNLEAGNTGFIYQTYISQMDEKIEHRW